MTCPHCGHTLTRERRALTAKQAAVYRLVKETIETTGAAPTLSQVATHFGYKSLSTVHELVGVLVEKGWLTREYNAQQGLQLVEHP